MKDLTLSLLVIFILVLHTVSTQDAERVQRWVVSGEPYQQRVVSLIPGNTQPPPWPPIPPPFPVSPLASPYPIQQALPMSPIPPPLPIVDSQQPWFLPSPVETQRSLWPPIPWTQTPVQSQIIPPSGIWPPPVPPLTLVAPTTVYSGPQESSSRDLDVGVYTGMDSPWTHLPPFSRTFNTGSQRGPVVMQPWESSSRDLDVGVGTGNDVAQPYQTWPSSLGPSYWQNNPRVPYPWLRQQGGFAIKRDDDDLKLTMHVPKDGVPGGVLIMELKASIYRPVY